MNGSLLATLVLISLTAAPITPQDTTPTPSTSQVAAAQPEPKPGPEPGRGAEAGPAAAASQPPAATLPAYKLVVKDGQLASHLLRVFVNVDIRRDQAPRLILRRSHTATTPHADEGLEREPVEILPNQTSPELIDGISVSKPGTILFFKLDGTHGEPFGVRPIVRVTPMLSWTDGGVRQIATTAREVNLGNIINVSAWTAVAMVVALGLILVLGRGRKTSRVSPMLFLTGVDGHLSLAQVQVACWTIAVGAVVFGYGMLRLQLPEIPVSLLLLMGFSLATGGLGFVGDTARQQAAVAAGASLPQRTWSWSDLVRSFDGSASSSPPQLSLAKAQMLMWTLILLSLFLSKSILDGAIWDVPGMLVGFMGVSQAGFLLPKFTNQPAAPVVPPAVPPVVPPAPPVPPPPPAEPGAPAGVGEPAVPAAPPPAGPPPGVG